MRNRIASAGRHGLRERSAQAGSLVTGQGMSHDETLS